MADELKPCPWCGSEPRLFVYNFGSYELSCDNDDCGVVCEAVRDTKEAAITAWNKRVKPEGGRE